MCHQLQVVRHRIDGLERWAQSNAKRCTVRHRIDGLEMAYDPGYGIATVRHRIDGLETQAAFERLF